MARPVRRHTTALERRRPWRRGARLQRLGYEHLTGVKSGRRRKRLQAQFRGVRQKKPSYTAFHFARHLARRWVAPAAAALCLLALAASSPYPNAGTLSSADPQIHALEGEVQRQAADLDQQRAMTSTYYQQILQRDVTIAKLNETLQADQVSLNDIAKQLGLPKEQLAQPAAAAKSGVGGVLPGDLAVLTKGKQPAGDGIVTVTSAPDLAHLVDQYLSLPCPLSPGHPLCAQAVDHAREELARGHGLNENVPNERPTLEADVTQPFGPTDVTLEPLVTIDGQTVHFHDGVDLATGWGEPVMAAGAGTVTFAGTLPSEALAVEITHAGGWRTLYLHESQILVSAGQKVQKGQIIGLTGSTGMSTGPHVHFSLEDPSGKPVDPWPAIK